MEEKKILSLNQTIATIVLFGYSTLMILLVCMDFFLIAGYQEKRRQEKQKAVNQYAVQAAEDMESMRTLLYDIYMNDEDFMELSKNPDSASQFSHSYELRESLKGHMMLNEGLHGFYIIYGDDTYPLYQVNSNEVTSEQGSRLCSALQQLEKQQNGIFRNWFCVTMEESVFQVTGYKKGTVTLYGVRNIGDAGVDIGTDANREIRVCLIDNGTILTNKELAERCEVVPHIVAGSSRMEYMHFSYQIVGEKIGNTSLWICAVYENVFGDYMSISQIFLLILTGVSVLLAIGIYRFLKKNLMTPLTDLRDEMEKVRGDLVQNVPIMNLRFSELKEMNETMQEMVTKLEHQRLLTYDAYIEEQKARMQYLQLQMQPHFYLNGLKTMNALVMEQQTDKVQSLILSLSEHLRYLLQAERETVTMQQELDFTINYVDVRRQMTGRTMQCVLEVEEEARLHEVPMLTVQTFVENSIKYAKTGSSNAALIIHVKVAVLETEEGNYVDIIVSDNGQGYPKEILEEINSVTKVGTRSIGIQNLKRRCEILYGVRAEFTFYNDDGAVSECILPVMEQKEEKE